jgi:hypothetical protein
MFNLEQAIAEWRRQMLAAGLKTPAPLDELESHLRDDLELQIKSGRSEADAFKTAMQKIGQPCVVQNEFRKVEEKTAASEVQFFLILLMVFASSAALCLAGMALFKISLGLKMMLTVGLSLELPVVMLVLVKRGRLAYDQLVRMRRHVIIWNFILGAVLTTPEVLTQVLMAAVLQVLYEMTVAIAWSWRRQENGAQKS